MNIFFGKERLLVNYVTDVIVTWEMFELYEFNKKFKTKIFTKRFLFMTLWRKLGH